MNESDLNVISENDFHMICRVCLQFKEDMVDIFTSGIDSQIMEVTRLQVKLNDKLPKTLCKSCKKQLHQNFKFLQQAKLSDYYLKSILTVKKQNLEFELEKEKLQKCLKKNKKEIYWSKSNEDGDSIYLIMVPKEGEIKVEDLNSEKKRVELVNYCKRVVKNQFYDHTYPKHIKEEVSKKEKIKSNKENNIFNVNLEVHKCGECDKYFEDTNFLADHVLSHDEKVLVTSTEYICPVCEVKESEKGCFLSHLLYHKENGFLFSKVNTNGSPVAALHSEKHIFLKSEEAPGFQIYMLNLNYFVCGVCKIVIENKDSVVEHFKSCTSDFKHCIKYSCPVCHESFIDDEDGYILHLGIHQNVSYMCVDHKGFPVEDDKFEVFLPLKEAVEIRKVFEGKFFKIQEDNLSQLCGFSETLKLLVKDHAHQHPEGKVTVQTRDCPVCGEKIETDNKYSQRPNFFEHLRKHKFEGFSFILVNANNMLVENHEFGDLFTQSERILLLLDRPKTNYDIWLPEICTQNEKLKNFTCDICQKQFDNKTKIIKHLKSHNNEKFKYICEKCGKKCNGKINYKKHFLNHSTLKRQKTCKICNKTFAKRATLSNHYRQHMKEGVVEGLDNSMSEIICEKCGKNFSNNASLTKHKKSHLKDKENSVFKCEICGRDFLREASFERHRSAHLNPKYFECEVCKLPLSSAATLNKHSETHKTGSETFDCNTCKISFLTKDSLTAHQVHKGHYKDRKPLECNVCHEKFFIGKNFTKHIKTHPKYKIGQCSLCGKRLSTIQSLMLHVGRHFESNSILCPHCGKQFFEERNYRRHLLAHQGIKPFPCDSDNCKKSFYTLFELNRHKKYHNNTRDFRCSFCSKSFHEANHLTVHIRTHTGEKPYTCPHCNKAFITRTRCKRHIKVVHQGVGYDLIKSNISKKVAVFEAIEAPIKH